MRGIETARAEMDVNYLGLLRLIDAFGGALKARAADELLREAAPAGGPRR